MYLINRICAYSFCFLIATLLVIAFARSYAQESDNSEDLAVFDSLVRESKARQDFYQGVDLLNSGNVSEAIIAFQRALSFDPDNNLVRYWLSRANNAYGRHNFARKILEELVQTDFYPTYISSQLTLSQLMSAGRNLLIDLGIRNAVRVVSLDLSKQGYRLPMSIHSLSSGEMLLSSLGSNTVSILTPLGGTSREILKNVTLLNRPTDSIQLINGDILVLEFGSNAIYRFSKQGEIIGKFTEEIPPDLIGPQYITSDADGNVYVSAYGSQRVLKFNNEGELLLSFGQRTAVFSGLSKPTGLVVLDTHIWVVSNNSDGLYLVKYDTNGNYINRYFMGTEYGESLRAYNNSLLLATHKSIKIFDVRSYIITSSLASEDFSKITSASFGSNDMLWVVDQERQHLDAFSTPTDQYTGLNVRVLSVSTDKYPTLSMRVAVDSTSNTPIVGLQKDSFLVFEDNVSTQVSLVKSDEETIQDTHVVLIPAASNRALHRAQIIESVQQLVDQNSDNEVLPNFWVMKSGKSVGYELREVNIGVQVVDAVKNAVNTAIPSNQKDEAQFQSQTFRIAANTLLPLAGKKTIIFLGEAPSLQALKSQAWKQTCNIAKHNAITMLWVVVSDVSSVSGQVKNTPQNEKLLMRQNIFASMLNEESSSVLYNDRNIFYYPNLGKNSNITLLQRAMQPHRGIYTLNITSRYAQQKGYFPKYVLLSVEGYYFLRSGKDVGGYIMPYIQVR